MSGGSVGQLGTTNSITFQVDGTVSGGSFYPATYGIGSAATISGGTWGSYAGASAYGPDLSGMTTPPTGGTFNCLVKINSALGWFWSYSLAGGLSANNILDGIVIFGFTGEVVLPTTGQVQSGMAFGPNGTYTGTLPGGASSYAC